MGDIFRGRSLRPHVLELIQKQAAEVAAEVPAKRSRKEDAPSKS